MFLKRKNYLHFKKIYCFFQVKQNLMSAVHGHQVSFPFFMAFISLLSNIELIKKIYLNATNGSRTTEVTKGVFLLKIEKILFIQIILFLYRGILAFCSNDVTNHTFGSGHSIQPLWSFASNRVSFCFSHMCAENSVCSFGQIRLELCLLLLLPYHRMSGQLPVEWRVVEDAEISKLAR